MVTHLSANMPEDAIAETLNPDEEVDRIEKTRKRTLGNVRLRHHETNELILIPTPSLDPNDPLNWSAYHWLSNLEPFDMSY